MSTINWQITPSKPLLSRALDYLFIGGLSIILLPILFLFSWTEEKVVLVGSLFYAAAFVVNYPHFLVSYQLLYKDYKALIFKDFRFLWAAVIVPSLLAVYLITATLMQSANWLGYIVQFMFIIVGWHYTKQAYGVVMVGAARNQYYFTKMESTLLKINMYALWFTSLVSFNIGLQRIDYWGISYSSINFHKFWLYGAYAVTLVSLTFFGMLLLNRIFREKKLPPLLAIIPFVAIYFWFLPLLYNPAFFLMLPFFHSIQYLLFVTALKKNEYLESNPKRSGLLTILYMGLSVMLGILFFESIPRMIEIYFPLNEEVLGATIWLFIFSVFINIHHYFIDNVIWRKDNKDLGKYLVNAP